MEPRGRGRDPGAVRTLLVVVLAVGAGGIAWVRSAEFGAASVTSRFGPAQAAGEETERTFELRILGVPTSSVRIEPSCQCARFRPERRQVVAGGVVISGNFVVDERKRRPGVRPGLWVLLAGRPLTLERP